MQPVFGAGDILIAKQITAKNAKVGEIVTFHNPVRDNQLVSHRLIEIEKLS